MDKPKQTDCSDPEFDRLLSLIMTEATAIEEMELVELIDVTGGFGGDILHVLPSRIYGGPRQDTIRGGAGNDII